MKFKKKSTIILLLLFNVIALYSQQWKQNFKVVEPIRVRDNSFAFSVFTNDGFAAYGADQVEVGGVENVGKVYIAKQDCDGWSIYQELTLSDTNNNCGFGSTLFMEGKTLAILGCDSANPNKGNAIYIYERDVNNLYVFTQKIAKPENVLSDNFGSNFAISDNYMVVGANYNSTDSSLANYMENAGAAYIYHRDADGIWSLMQKIVPSDRERRDTFGNSVAIFENTIVVGAVEEGSNWAGAAYVFEKGINSNKWNEVKKLVAYDYRSLQDRFGEVVRINENGIMIAAPKEDDYDSDLSGDGGGPLTALGSVYIFKKNSNNEWVGHQKIRASDGSVNYFGFGDRMEIYSDQIAIRGTEYEYDNNGNLSKVFGRVYMFKKGDNDIWEEYQIIESKIKHNSDWFANSISLFKEDLFIGAFWDGLDANDQNYIAYAGSVYIFNTYDYINTQKPVLNSLTVLESCADLGNGFSSGFDTSSLQKDLVQNPDNFIFTYKDQLGNPLPSPLPVNYANKYPFTETINIIVGNKNNRSCYEETKIELKTKPSFILNTIPDLNECDSDGTGYATFDLSKINSLLVVDPSLYNFSYFDKNEKDITTTINGTYRNSIKNHEEITVIVKDVNTSCIAKTKIYLNVSNVGLDCELSEDYVIPKFFTPNGDGVNDIWEVAGIKNQNYIIYIYDRYGKLLKTLGYNVGWDGNYNGRPLPSSDYWFELVSDRGVNIKGHFSLKR